MTPDALRWLAAGAAVLAYAAMCAAIGWRERRRAAAAAADAAALAGIGAAAGQPVLVAHASQTGQAEELAWQTARWLHAGGTPVWVLPLNAVDGAMLASASRALFIASTYGEGDAPDGASVFVDQVMGARSPPALGGLSHAVLALGDREYDQFCGFGRTLDAWLQAQGAQPAFERIDVDKADPAALAEWRRRLRPDADAQEAAAAADALPAFEPWRLVSRVHLNPGSAGGPVFELAFAPPRGHEPDWQSGDLVQVQLAGEPDRPRDYSIASTVRDAELQLIVRQERHADGRLGAASGLLTSTLSIGGTVAMRLRPHRTFRLDGNASRPLILVGNGTGIAGLRAHLRERAATQAGPNWLIFGERQAKHDFLCREELLAWQREGVLTRLDMVFSRDQAERRYVQHRLLQAGDELRTWLDQGAAVYVCGSLEGMASGVDAALRQVMGDAALQALQRDGRYRRDVY